MREEGDRYQTNVYIFSFLCEFYTDQWPRRLCVLRRAISVHGERETSDSSDDSLAEPSTDQNGCGRVQEKDGLSSSH